MKWTLKDIKQETNHKFLNFFTLIYEVEDEKGKRNYEYFMASRRAKEDLFAISKSFRPDGVLIPCYYIDSSNEVSIILTRQFRPAVNTYVTSIPAGLLDINEDIFSAAIREAKEEVGVDITDLELLCPPSFSSTGLADESNAVVLGRITSFKDSHLEEFEDISHQLVKLKDVEKMLNNNTYIIPTNIRLIIKYLLLRFKNSL